MRFVQKRRRTPASYGQFDATDPLARILAEEANRDLPARGAGLRAWMAGDSDEHERAADPPEVGRLRKLLDGAQARIAALQSEREAEKAEREAEKERLRSITATAKLYRAGLDELRYAMCQLYFQEGLNVGRLSDATGLSRADVQHMIVTGKEDYLERPPKRRSGDGTIAGDILARNF